MAKSSKKAAANSKPKVSKASKSSAAKSKPSAAKPQSKASKTVARPAAAKPIKVAAKKPVKKALATVKKASATGKKVLVSAKKVLAQPTPAATAATRAGSAKPSSVQSKQVQSVALPVSSSKRTNQGPSINQPTMNREKTKEKPAGNSAQKQGSKTAPPMRLSPNDSDVIASAKERYGAKDLVNFKKLIIEQRAEASEEFDIISEQMLDTSGEFDADNQSYALHTAEQGTDAMEREKTFLHAQRTSDYIKKLDEALERIDRGTYGICVICGMLIEKERLAAVPITQKHVDCKNKTQAKKLSVDQVYHDVEEAVE